jgi:hypothetical protein
VLFSPLSLLSFTSQLCFQIIASIHSSAVNDKRRLKQISKFQTVEGCLRNVPHCSADGWDNIIVGMKVEVENSDAAPIPGVFHTAFWVATVLRISGYKES